MSPKKLEAIAYSTGGALALFLILVGFNFIVGLGNVRMDLTDEKLHTLSDGTKSILEEIDGEVEVRFYLTQDDSTPVPLKSFAKRVEDLLDQYKEASGGNLIVKRLNPEEFSDAEDSAKLDGITPQRLRTGDPLYFGVAISFLDSTETLPVLTMQREHLLEYDISRAISNVLTPKKAKIGVLSGLPVMGGAPTPQMMQRGQMQGSEPWMLVTLLKQDFEVEEVSTSATEIPDLDVLLIIHPKELSDETLYAIDQYILGGGRVIGMLDAMPIEDPSGINQQMMGMNLSPASSLGKLMDTWGLKLDGQKVLADLSYPTQVGGGGGQAVNNPAVLSLPEEAFDQDDVVFSQVSNIILPLAGAFTGDAAAGLTKTVLMKSSDKAALVDRISAQMSPQSIKDKFTASDEPLAIAVRLSGKFKTAFPDGKPKSDEAAEGEEKKDDTSAHLTESATENSIILIADADFCADRFSVRVQNFLGQRMLSYINGNLNLVQSLVEQMAGDNRLIGSRSRAIKVRPFTVVKEKEAEAQEKFQAKIKESQDKIQELERKLNELQRNKQDDQKFIMSPEQQAEIDNFQEEQVAQRKKLKEVQKELRKDIDSLQNGIKVVNIAGIPFIVALLGIGVFIFKRSRNSAK